MVKVGTIYENVFLRTVIVKVLDVTDNNVRFICEYYNQKTLDYDWKPNKVYNQRLDTFEMVYELCSLKPKDRPRLLLLDGLRLM